MIVQYKLNNRDRAAFTMVEIALSIGIVAFALVAILGVLPTGLNVKKDNREDTVIQEDAAYFMEAIRNGSRGLDHLTNFVEDISHDWGDVEISTGKTNAVGKTLKATLFPAIKPKGNPPNQILPPGALIIGRLSTPDWVRSPRGTNYLRASTNIAFLRAITGSSVEQGKVSRDFGFRYKMSTELIPYSPMPQAYFSGNTNSFAIAQNLSSNLYELRLTMQWPVFPRGGTNAVGRNLRTFRSILSGTPQLVEGSDGTNYYFFQPHTFVFANAR